MTSSRALRARRCAGALRTLPRRPSPTLSGALPSWVTATLPSSRCTQKLPLRQRCAAACLTVYTPFPVWDRFTPSWGAVPLHSACVGLCVAGLLQLCLPQDAPPLCAALSFSMACEVLRGLLRQYTDAAHQLLVLGIVGFAEPARHAHDKGPPSGPLCCHISCHSPTSNTCMQAATGRLVHRLPELVMQASSYTAWGCAT